MASADRLIEVFDGARARPPGLERDAWLDAACDGEPELREQVRSLLQANDEAGEFLWREAQVPVLTEQPGDWIGRYRIIELIGVGGYGAVYMAGQEEPVRRRVALKVIKLGMDTKEVVGRFEAERQALAMMDHPNIARVFDAGATDAGRPYFVMELVQGIKLTGYCDRHHLPTEERLQLFAQVCHAIQHAHQKGIIHRDIKPSNILVAESDGVPVPKVIDFGIAKATEQRLTAKTFFTGLEQFIGTPAYMSPEQATMTSLDIDTRSDIYSLGVLLYELLTGRTPFDAGKLIELGIEEIRRTIREEEPVKPSTRLSTLTQADLSSTAASRRTDPPKLLERVRGDLDWIALKCLEKDRARRYETVSGLARDIEHYLHDEPVLATPPSAWYRVRKFVRRHKGPVLAGSLILVALIAGIVGTTWGMIRAGEAVAVAKQSEREKSERLLEALTAQARATRLTGRSGQRFETLEIIGQATKLAHSLGSPPAALRELRTGATAALARPDIHFTASRVSWTPDSSTLAFDSAHALCARIDRKGNCSIRRVEDDVEIHNLPGLGEVALPLFSHDSRFIALMHHTRDGTNTVAVHIWHLNTAPQRILAEPGARTASFRGSSEVVIVYNDGHLGRFTLPDGQRLNSLPAGPFGREVNIALHPSEPLVAMASYFTNVVDVRDLETGGVVKSLPQKENVTSVAWHPDGSRLAVGYAEARQIRFYDRASWQMAGSIKTRQAMTMLSFNDEGNWLATNGWNNILEVFEIDSEGRGITAAPALTSPGLVWNGSCLAAGVQNGRTGIWQFADGREVRTLVRDEAPDGLGYYAAALHPDGRLLAVRMTDGIGFWDLITRRQRAFIPEDVDDCNFLFEPSGSLLTLMQKGLMRWPVRADVNDPDHLIVGPPEQLPTPGRHNMGQSRDGKVTAICNRSLVSQQDRAGGWIHHADRPEAPIRIDPKGDVSRIAVSPDGRWVVTATHSLGDAKLWDARDGTFVRQLADRGAGSENPRFSPDGRWLSMGHDGGRVVSTETWEAGPPVGRTGVFTPDGRLIAVAVPTGVRLVEHATGREIAMLEDPNLYSPPVNLFNKDGTKLISLDQSRGVHVWDLRLIRQELKARGLDWEWPEFQPEKP